VDLDAVWDGEWGRSNDWCISSGGNRRRVRGSFGPIGGQFGASHCNQWGLS